VSEWKRASVVIIPSRYESFGLVAIEAMARGKPILATNGGGLGEVVGSAGMVVPVEDAEAMGDSLVRLLGSAALRERFRREGRARYERLYRPECLHKALLGLVDRIASR